MVTPFRLLFSTLWARGHGSTNLPLQTRSAAVMPDCDQTGDKACGEASECEGKGGRNAHGALPGAPVSAAMRVCEDGEPAEIRQIAAPAAAP